MYKPIKKGLRTNISPGLIFGGLRYARKATQLHETQVQVALGLIQIEQPKQELD